MENLAPQSLEIDGWIFRQRVPYGGGPHPLILMLHGWTGDEQSMWVFSSRLPLNAMLLAPRGLYEAPGGGYTWHPHRVKAWPWVDDFQPSIEALRHVLTPENFPSVDFSNVSMVGFSQGAALAFSYGLLYPYQVKVLAGLSGFLPDGAEALVRNRPLADKQVFLAHGAKDELVPVERARQAARLLEQAGAQVMYCEDDVGHRLSRSCFRGMQAFFGDW
jgi:phospholipase/carboxylesterase